MRKTNKTTVSSNEGVPIAFETRYRKLKAPNVPGIVAFISEAIQTAGSGSVVAVGDKGVQLTLPIELMHNVWATIEEYDEMDPMPEMNGCIFYTPAISVSGDAEDVATLANRLGLVPADMNVAGHSLGEMNGVLVVAGPKERQKHYADVVVVQLKSLANSVSGIPSV